MGFLKIKEPSKNIIVVLDVWSSLVTVKILFILFFTTFVSFTNTSKLFFFYILMSTFGCYCRVSCNTTIIELIAHSSFKNYNFMDIHLGEFFACFS